jgi:hypothetical protein
MGSAFDRKFDSHLSQQSNNLHADAVLSDAKTRVICSFTTLDRLHPSIITMLSNAID